ncbi:hypothetical protein [Zavarzinella formosa]|uniref:hypothetical protein n=1 Tax=Zavarzinella formosa TaxID=360055 RepID=UPI000308FBF4|nr:hypothetical protein [Zavarzinella formosa]
MSKPTDKRSPEPTPEKEPSESTVEMPMMRIVPDLSEPQDTLVMPAFKLPKKPHLGNDTEAADNDKK